MAADNPEEVDPNAMTNPIAADGGDSAENAKVPTDAGDMELSKADKKRLAKEEKQAQKAAAVAAKAEKKRLKQEEKQAKKQAKIDAAAAKKQAKLDLIKAKKQAKEEKKSSKKEKKKKKKNPSASETPGDDEGEDIERINEVQMRKKPDSNGSMSMTSTRDKRKSVEIKIPTEDGSVVIEEVDVKGGFRERTSTELIDLRSQRRISLQDEEFDIVHFDEKDREFLAKVSETEHGKLFTLGELQRLYIGFKDNNETITMEDFKIVYATYSKMGDSPIAEQVFHLFDKNHDGSFSFEEFIAFLAMITKGSVQQRATFCFNLYDSDGKGFLTKEGLLATFSRLPVAKMVDKRHSIFSSERTGSDTSLDLIMEEDEDEETEERIEKENMAKAEAAYEKNKKVEDMRVKAMLVNAYRTGSGSSVGSNKPEDDPRNRMKAAEAVNNIFEEIPHEEHHKITLEEFLNSVEVCESIQAFFPF